MAEVQIADIYEAETFRGLVQERMTELNRYIRSGIVFDDAALTQQISAGGLTGELTNYNPLTIDEPDYATDDPANKSTPNKIDSKVQRFRGLVQHKSWSAMDFARHLALPDQDPLTAIVNQVAQYFVTNDERRILQSLIGIMNDNIANDASDMINDVSTPTGAIGDANRISLAAVIDAKQTLGDHANTVAAIGMHSLMYSKLQKDNQIDFIPASDTNIMIPRYGDLDVIVDDSTPVDTSNANPIYTCPIYAQGVIAHGARMRGLTPTELYRDPTSGNGSGQDTLHYRKGDVWHPVGFDFTSTTLSGPDGYIATQADLALAVNWDRKYLRKNTPMAFLRVNA